MSKTFHITRVTARNFRSIARTSFDLDPFTVLVGPNASGKSNAMDILRFVRDALRFDLEAAISMRGGIKSIRYRTRGGRPPDMEIGVRAQGGTFAFEYGFVIAADQRKGYRVKRELLGMRQKQGIPFTIRITEGEGELLSPREPSQGLGVKFETNNLSLRFLTLPIWKSSQVGEDDETINRATFWLNRGLRDMHFYHIFPKDIREPQKLSSDLPLAEYGENLASVLRYMSRRYPKALERLRLALSHLVSHISDVRVSSTGGYLVTRLQHVNGGEPKKWFDLSQESDGTLRLLGLLVALYQQPVPGVIGIEEPEFAIHPGALTALGEILEEAALTSQILITTHSPELIDEVPVDSVRVVDSTEGATTIGRVSIHQVEAVREKLFLPGELHRMEGLQMATPSGG